MKTSTHYYSTFRVPVGKFSVAVDESGAVVATAFGAAGALRKRLGRNRARLRPDPDRTSAVRGEIEAYFRDSRHRFGTALAPAGSAFQHRVWQALRAIPAGETRSYGELARSLRTGARAVGRANATNPICLIVPCHRVIGADGSLTGFAFGEAIKGALLRWEGAAAGRDLSGGRSAAISL